MQGGEWGAGWRGRPWTAMRTTEGRRSHRDSRLVTSDLSNAPASGSLGEEFLRRQHSRIHSAHPRRLGEEGVRENLQHGALLRADGGHPGCGVGRRT